MLQPIRDFANQAEQKISQIRTQIGNLPANQAVAQPAVLGDDDQAQLNQILSDLNDVSSAVATIGQAQSVQPVKPIVP